MPYLRFTRDKRGYENTYVMHSFRRGGRARPQILYWFRTPPNVRVGRAALDEDAIRSIEENHPHLVFDWTKMVKTQTSTASQPPPSRKTSRGSRRQPAGAGATVGRGATARTSRPVVGGSVGTKIPEDFTAEEPVERLASEASPELTVGAPEPSEIPEDTAISGERVVEAASPAPAVNSQTSTSASSNPVEALIGAEGRARLQARHAELLARVSERVSDPARRAVLRSEAERLDPSTWVTVEEARDGIAGFDVAFEALRAKLGRRRRRSRRGGVRRTRRRKAALARAAGTADADSAEVEQSRPPSLSRSDPEAPEDDE